MFIILKKTKLIAVILGLVLLCAIISLLHISYSQATSSELEKKYIKWVDFDIPAGLMKEAIKLDVTSYQEKGSEHTGWIELLAYLGTKYGGDFKKYKPSHLKTLLKEINEGKTMTVMAAKLKNYPYYLEAYQAVLGGLVGEFEAEVEEENGKIWQKKYGLKAYSPIAKGYAYDDYDDFGARRDYGYRRKHLGHDMMALVGTPVIAVESGVVEVLGWNQFGGWRIGIRSFDGHRYYYYAHLRKNRPFAAGLEEGQIVMAGNVIGYVGRTGYSATENVNGIENSHLHFGLQLIFDESQKEGKNQIWIDLYELTKLLSNNRSTTLRDDATKEHSRALGFKEAIPKNHFTPKPGDKIEEKLESDN
ncbi:MAG: M23 family metallopeptidase [Clostridiales bacterium]|nr:M23 family metallopeptidase [Clostridiales bacterium]